MGQTSIRASRSGAFAGQLAEELAPHHRRTGVVAAGKTATPGQPVIITGQGPNGEDLVRDIEDGDTLTAANCGGFVKLDAFRENEGAAPGSGYGAGRTVTLIREGVLFVQATAAASNRNAVYVGNTTATLGQIAGAAGAGLVRYPSAAFLEAGGTDEPARIHIRTDLPAT